MHTYYFLYKGLVNIDLLDFVELDGNLCFIQYAFIDDKLFVFFINMKGKVPVLQVGKNTDHRYNSYNTQHHIYFIYLVKFKKPDKQYRP